MVTKYSSLELDRKYKSTAGTIGITIYIHVGLIVFFSTGELKE